MSSVSEVHPEGSGDEKLCEFDHLKSTMQLFDSLILVFLELIFSLGYCPLLFPDCNSKKLLVSTCGERKAL